MGYEVGSLVEGRVVDIVKFGAFVKIRGGKTGLVHISQISDKFVREVSDYMAVGARVVAKIISVDDKGRVQLSIKDVSPEELEKFEKELEAQGGRDHAQDREFEPEREEQPYRRQQHHYAGDDSFEAKLKRFMRQSEDRLIDLKRNTENKRGGGMKRKKK